MGAQYSSRRLGSDLVVSSLSLPETFWGQKTFWHQKEVWPQSSRRDWCRRWANIGLQWRTQAEKLDGEVIGKVMNITSERIVATVQWSIVMSEFRAECNWHLHVLQVAFLNVWIVRWMFSYFIAVIEKRESTLVHILSYVTYRDVVVSNVYVL